MDQIAQKISQFQLDGTHRETLAQAGHILIPHLDAVLSSFYDRALADPTSAAFFKGQDRIDFARGAQKNHWIRLLSAQLDSTYAASIDRIGRTHARINLPLDIYMSAYAGASGQLMQILADLRDDDPALAGGARRGDLVAVVSRAFAFDIEQVTTVTFAVWGEEQEKALDHLGSAIEAFSQGDLSHRVHGPHESDFPQSYNGLRVKMNTAGQNLSHMISQIAEAMDAMLALVDEVKTSADQLSQRTTTQAASLEETAAAMEEVTNSVAESAKNTGMSDQVARDARDEVDRSATVVQHTAEAMEEIKASSEKVAQITSLIDTIAFQTNLLALNAGVEAARAGDAGRGFAVVATEVRNLAANSSNAAKDIKDLISESSEQVKRGVELVETARKSLVDLVSSFTQVSDLSTQVRAASEEQSRALSEINSGVAHLDGITQKNAAMVENTNDQMRQVGEQATHIKSILADMRIAPIATGTRDAAPHAQLRRAS